MRKHLSAVLCAGLALALLGCSGAVVPRPQEPQESIVFGHIDMSDAPVSLQWVSIRQYAPPSEAPYWSAGVQDGVYWQWYLKPGSYGVDSFGGSGFNSNYSFNMPRQSKALRLVIQKPGIYFLGSYKYKPVKTGFFEPGKYDLEESDKPTEAEVLHDLLKLVKGTPVEPKLQARLKEVQ
jgi:hypothetical protein